MYSTLDSTLQPVVHALFTHPQSLIEQKTLRELGVSSLPEWKIVGERVRFLTSNNQKRDARLPLELDRLKAHAAKTGSIVESIHINGIAEYYGFKG